MRRGVSTVRAASSPTAARRRRWRARSTEASSWEARAVADVGGPRCAVHRRRRSQRSAHRLGSTRRRARRALRHPRRRRSLRCRAHASRTAPLLAFAISPDGTTVLAGGPRRWDLSRGRRAERRRSRALVSEDFDAAGDVPRLARRSNLRVRRRHPRSTTPSPRATTAEATPRPAAPASPACAGPPRLPRRIRRRQALHRGPGR